MSRYPGLAKVIRAAGEEATRHPNAEKIARKSRSLKIHYRAGENVPRLHDEVKVGNTNYDPDSIDNRSVKRNGIKSTNNAQNNIDWGDRSIPERAIDAVNWSKVTNKPNIPNVGGLASKNWVKRELRNYKRIN